MFQLIFIFHGTTSYKILGPPRWIVFDDAIISVLIESMVQITLIDRGGCSSTSIYSFHYGACPPASLRCGSLASQGWQSSQPDLHKSGKGYEVLGKNLLISSWNLVGSFVQSGWERSVLSLSIFTFACRINLHVFNQRALWESAILCSLALFPSDCCSCQAPLKALVMAPSETTASLLHSSIHFTSVIGPLPRCWLSELIRETLFMALPFSFRYWCFSHLNRWKL